MDRAARLAQALIHGWEQYREYAYPDPYSPLGKRTRGRRWGYEPAQAILESLPSDLASLSGDPWTVGYGSTGRWIGPATRWSREIAQVNAEAAIEATQDGVRRLVKVPLQPWQEAALISFAYNVGLDEDADLTPEGLGDSTLLKRVNASDFAGAAREFGKWINAGGERSKGLAKRREEERLMFTGAHSAIRA